MPGFLNEDGSEQVITAIEAAIMHGKAYSADIFFSGAATGYCALSLFNPAGSGKTFRVYLVKYEEDSTQFARLQKVSVDPNFNGTNKGTLTPNNLLIGSSQTSVANVTYSKTGAEVLAGTDFDIMTNVGGWTEEMVVPPDSFAIQPGNGVILYIHSAADGFMGLMKWIEG